MSNDEIERSSARRPVEIEVVRASITQLSLLAQTLSGGHQGDLERYASTFAEGLGAALAGNSAPVALIVRNQAIFYAGFEVWATIWSSAASCRYRGAGRVQHHPAPRHLARRNSTRCPTARPPTQCPATNPTPPRGVPHLKLLRGRCASSTCTEAAPHTVIEPERQKSLARSRSSAGSPSTSASLNKH